MLRILELRKFPLIAGSFEKVIKDKCKRRQEKQREQKRAGVIEMKAKVITEHRDGGGKNEPRATVIRGRARIADHEKREQQ